MTYSFETLNPSTFEALCAKILVAENYAVLSPPGRATDIGVDFTGVDHSGQSVVVEVQHYRKSLAGSTRLAHAVAQLGAARSLLGVSRGILFVSSVVPAAMLSPILAAASWLTIYDGVAIAGIVQRHPSLSASFALAPTAPAPTLPSPSSRAQDLTSRLSALPAGRPDAKNFEELGVEILNFVFFPNLRVPRVQARSEDGLDIRDAVYPIAGGVPFWDEIRRSCSTRFAVAEFKNYSDRPGQKEVESIQQYLMVKAMRTFGFLVSRKPPSESAIKARRRAWMEQDKLIVFLDDESMKELITMRDRSLQVAELIDDQLTEFFADLAP